MKNKKGTSVIWGFMIMFFAFFLALGLGITVLGFGLVNDVLSQDVDLGQVNLKNVSDTTFGQINTGLVDNADTLGVIMLLGMCLLMILNGYYLGSKSPKMFFIVDIFLLALFFIPSIYISQVYEIFINSAPIFSDIFIDVIPKTSKFILNLPTIIGTVGVITMIVSYAGIRRDDEKAGGEVNVLGY